MNVAIMSLILSWAIFSVMYAPGRVVKHASVVILKVKRLREIEALPSNVKIMNPTTQTIPSDKMVDPTDFLGFALIIINPAVLTGCARNTAPRYDASHEIKKSLPKMQIRCVQQFLRQLPQSDNMMKKAQANTKEPDVTVLVSAKVI